MSDTPRTDALHSWMLSACKESAIYGFMLDHSRELERENARLRTALADAIRRPMGVIPASAEGLVTDDELRSAEWRRSPYNPNPKTI